MTEGDGALQLVDTHCHLVLLDERGLLGESLEEAAAAGVEQIVTVGLNVEDSAPRAKRKAAGQQNATRFPAISAKP